ncbi:hypothetical protein [Salinicola sp. MIT1003]|jgi:hypothetical protein|uniref:hypothetical protein n=1 Tax=Salinicola sp. MIT1003 TaxID=1882734 RepID=UPI0008DC8EDB|nr:hypothetical protein [Salinicola sp. MIT1003]OHZ02989.1 hypothetical protein BC443_14970 [Salinicola sp. MIT1003]
MQNIKSTISKTVGTLAIAGIASGITWLITYDHMVHKIADWSDQASVSFNAQQKVIEALSDELTEQCIANSNIQRFKPDACLNAVSVLEQRLDYNKVPEYEKFVEEFQKNAQRNFFYKRLAKEASELADKHRAIETNNNKADQ